MSEPHGEPPHAQGAVRLRVTYQSPRSLVAELTRSVGRGPVALESRRPLPRGSRFELELRAHGVAVAVQVLGEVVLCEPAQGPPGRWELGIQYRAGEDLRGLEEALRWISESHRQQPRRRAHPRIPIFFQAGGGAPTTPLFAVRDLSRGGAGVKLESGEAPRSLQAGAPALLELLLPGRALLLHGEVAWRSSAAFGMRFGRLRPDAVERLGEVLALRGLPAPPWKARLSFGMDAVSRMP